MNDDEKFVVGVGEEIAKKYQLGTNRYISDHDVPENLRSLISAAERWGENDDILRERLVAAANPKELAALKNLLSDYEHEIFRWLAGPEAKGPNFSDAYICFTALMLVYDSV